MDVNKQYINNFNGSNILMSFILKRACIYQNNLYYVRLDGRNDTCVSEVHC